MVVGKNDKYSPNGGLMVIYLSRQYKIALNKHKHMKHPPPTTPKVPWDSPNENIFGVPRLCRSGDPHEEIHQCPQWA